MTQRLSLASRVPLSGQFKQYPFICFCSRSLYQCHEANPFKILFKAISEILGTIGIIQSHLAEKLNILRDTLLLKKIHLIYT